MSDVPHTGSLLGVDFGTSHTVATLRWPDGRSKPLLFDGTPLLPSAVYAPSAGALCVGRDALHHGRHRPDSLEPNPKRRIDDGSVLLGEREIPVADLVGAVLSRVADEAGRVAGRSPNALVLSHPAGWGPVRRLTLRDAALAAGLPEPELVAEPVAAARYFSAALGGTVPAGQVLVVYDLGAGTFDVSVIRAGEVLANDGLDDVGGLDFDAAIVGWLRERYDDATWQRLLHPTTVDDRRLGQDLWAEARAAKEILSRSPSVPLRPPLLAETPFTLDDFERLAQPLIDRTVRTAVGLTRYCGVTAAHVLLVGGSSRIPLVTTALRRAFGVPPTVTDQPETVVAEGCVFAVKESGLAAAPVSRTTDTAARSAPHAVSAPLVSPSIPVAPPSPVVPAQRGRTDADTEPLPVLSARSTGAPPRERPVYPRSQWPAPPDSSAPHSPEPPRRVAPHPAGPDRLRGNPPTGQVIERPPSRSGRNRRALLTLLSVLALVTALVATTVAINVFGGSSNNGRATPGTDAPGSTVTSGPALPNWAVRYRDSLQSQRGWSAAAIPGENASCTFRNDRLEIDMAKGGILRCPGQRDDLTDFVLTINVSLLAGLPCAGLWLRRGPHEAGRDAGYLVQVCPNQMILGHHHAGGDIVPFATFPTSPIQQGQQIRVSVMARGDEISVYRADQFVGTARDSAYQRGRIALGIAVKAEAGEGHLAFRDVELRWP